MKREKVIISLSALIILAVLGNALFGLEIFDHKKNVDSVLLNQKSGDLELSKVNKIPISKIEWSKDIFYDRSNVYDSWFTLTGITKFENGYKAIINGEIVNEMNRVRGFLVRKITQNRVQLEKNDYHVTLKLKE